MKEKGEGHCGGEGIRAQEAAQGCQLGWGSTIVKGETEAYLGNCHRPQGRSEQSIPGTFGPNLVVHAGRVSQQRRLQPMNQRPSAAISDEVIERIKEQY